MNPGIQRPRIRLLSGTASGVESMGCIGLAMMSRDTCDSRSLAACGGDRSAGAGSLPVATAQDRAACRRVCRSPREWSRAPRESSTLPICGVSKESDRMRASGDGYHPALHACPSTPAQPRIPGEMTRQVPMMPMTTFAASCAGADFLSIHALAPHATWVGRGSL